MALLAALLFLASQAPEAPLDFSCATFHAFISEADLIARYGASNVVNQPVVGADDGPVPGTVLFPNDPSARVVIAWGDVAARRAPDWVRVEGARSSWRTLDGIELGRDLRSIERLNGWPFRIGGLSGESRGGVVSWGQGRLNQGPPNCDIRIHFQTRGGEDPALVRQVQRGPSSFGFSSGHLALQELNPQVSEMWIRYPEHTSRGNPAYELLDVMVFGLHAPIDPAAYTPELRAEVETYLRRARAYRPTGIAPAARVFEMHMVHAARTSYETRLVAVTDDPRAPALAVAYVRDLGPCYEWEGFSDCPEADAIFADDYQRANPTGPFRHYLPLLAAHRWLCAAEYEMKPEVAARDRRLHEERLATARKSESLLVRAAAEALANRGSCIGGRN